MRVHLAILAIFVAWGIARQGKPSAAVDARRDAVWSGSAGQQPQPGDVAAIADLHGDYGKAVQALRLLGVVDENLSWVARGVTLVQLGDIPDRGASSLEVTALFSRIKGEAEALGSRVVLLLGNHCLMNLMGDLRYVSPTELMRLGAGGTMGSAGAEAAAAEGSGGDGGGSGGSSAGDEIRGGAFPPALHHHRHLSLPAGSSGGAGGHQNGDAVEDPATWPQSRQAAAAAAGAEEWLRLLGPGQLLGDELRGRVLVAVEGEGECRSLFVHAGLLPHSLEELMLAADDVMHEQQQQQQQQQQPEEEHGGSQQQQQQQQQEGQQQQQGQQQQDGQQQQRPLTPASVARINAAVSHLLSSCLSGSCGFSPRGRRSGRKARGSGGGSGPSPAEARLASALLSPGGPVWARALALGPEGEVCPWVDALLAAVRPPAHRVVVGHTVQRGGRAGARCGGRVLLLDTGMSSEMAGAPAAAWLCRAAQGGGEGGAGDVGGVRGAGGSEEALAAGEKSGSHGGGGSPLSVVLYGDGRVQGT